MNLTLMKAFWRERFTSPGRLVLVIMAWAWPLFIAFLSDPVRELSPMWTVWPALILGAGVIGRDISTGVLQLLFARPVRRHEYVFSRWIALGAAVFAVMFLGWLVALPFSLAGGGTTALEALRMLADTLLLAFGLAAVLTGLSAVVPGFGDVAVWTFFIVLDSTVGLMGTLGHKPIVQRISQIIIETLIPHVQLQALHADGQIHLEPVAAWLSTVTLALLLAVAMLNRREFSYASAG